MVVRLFGVLKSVKTMQSRNSAKDIHSSALLAVHRLETDLLRSIDENNLGLMMRLREVSLALKQQFHSQSELFNVLKPLLQTCDKSYATWKQGLTVGSKLEMLSMPSEIFTAKALQLSISLIIHVVDSNL